MHVASVDQVVVPCLGSEPQKFSNLTVTEKSYQAPYARVTSLEDPAAPNLGYGGVPASESEMAAEHAENGSITVHVSGFKNSSLTDITHETHEKPRSKESKGFRKLLKFGRKSHGSASGEGNLDSDASSVDDPTVTAASSNDGKISASADYSFFFFILRNGLLRKQLNSSNQERKNLLTLITSLSLPS